MCILLNVKKHEKTFALNVDIFSGGRDLKKQLTNPASPRMIKTAKNKGCEKEEYT